MSVRPFPLDGALLLFDRDSGRNVLCEGPETAHLRQAAPRVVQFAITNACNLACTFCSRDCAAESAWTAECAFAMLAGLAVAGVLEVAFGGGEPLAFRGFDALVRRLYEETPLAVSFTTNGLLLDAARLQRLRGRYGQIRLSLYEDNDWRARVELLAAAGARFGVNYLVTPERLETLETVVLELVARGCRDLLLLSYNGAGPLHLAAPDLELLERKVALLEAALRGRAVLKLDVCWGDRLEAVPRLFARSDCGAGVEFLVLTSDRRLMPCSFHTDSIPVECPEEVMKIWRTQRARLTAASTVPGCARLPDYGLGRGAS